MNKKVSRKDFLKLGVYAGVSGVAISAMTNGLFAAACGNPKHPSAAALKYVASSTVSGKTCANCMHYANKNGNCGTCALFGNDQVAAKGYCTAWAKKA